jgi:hypothetical protein
MNIGESNIMDMEGNVERGMSPPTVLTLRPYGVVKIFDAVSIAASAYSESSIIVVSGLDGYFSLQWTITGLGTAKIEVYNSINGVDFLDLSTDIATAQIVTSGPGANGKNAASFSVMLSSLIKIRVTETAGAVNAVVISAWLKGK